MTYLSIIIPFYNADKEPFYKCLDSIYMQNLQIEDFEVVIVNDCSTNLKSVYYLENYIERKRLTNITVIHHEINKRQGGARNTAVKKAKGKFIQYIDQDDYFESGSLELLLNSIKNNDSTDILMMDFMNYNVNTKIFSGPYYKNNCKSILKGSEFMVKCEIPWEPWQYCYRRQFLLENNLFFEENVRFEDVDYVMKATVLANSICYIPIIKIIHTQNSNQTSLIGSDLEKITDLVKISYRIRLVGESFKNLYPEAAKIIIGHHQFGYDSFLKRYLWRINPKSFLYLIKNYPPLTPSEFKLLNWVNRYPKAFTYTCALTRPLLFLSRKIFLRLKK